MPKPRILVVEDNALNAKLLRDALEYNGYDITVAESAEIGIEAARELIPDLVLMDIQLPGMDGAEALGILKAGETTRSIPVIAVSASAMPAESEQILAAGFDGFQTKPISVVKILEEIRRFVGAGEAS